MFMYIYTCINIYITVLVTEYEYLGPKKIFMEQNIPSSVLSLIIVCAKIEWSLKGDHPPVNFDRKRPDDDGQKFRKKLNLYKRENDPKKVLKDGKCSALRCCAFLCLIYCVVFVVEFCASVCVFLEYPVIFKFYRTSNFLSKSNDVKQEYFCFNFQLAGAIHIFLFLRS